MDTSVTVTESRPGQSTSQWETPWLRLWQRLALGIVLLISIFMNFYQLGQSGFGNLYYASGVRSMVDSFHNFFFVSYDPGGFITIDKPPLGFWLQAISVKIFGFTPFSIFLPQALAGVLSVILLYALVRRHFGVTAGLLAALALAITPISVVTNRNNTIDSTLALVMLLGAWAVIRAVETGKWRWLLLCAAFVGIGFNIKMLESYLVVPAFGLLYLLAAPRGVWMCIGQLALATLFMLVISFSWAAVVDLTPAAQRPYVGSTQNNSEISLAFGYNGLNRIKGLFGTGKSDSGDTDGNAMNPLSITGSVYSGLPILNMGTGGPTEPGHETKSSTQQPQSISPTAPRIGPPGPLRFFNAPLGGQIVWLLPIALLGMIALAWQHRPRFRQDRKQQALLLWGGWMLTMLIYFSATRSFREYYLPTLTPAISALFGVGIAVMWQDYRRVGWRGWLLPLALLAAAFEQIHIIVSNPAWGTWLIPLIAVPCVLVASVLIVARLIPRLNTNSRVLVAVLCLSLIALMLTPAFWSSTSTIQHVSTSAPVAGPGQQPTSSETLNASEAILINYLEAHQGSARFLVATPNSSSASAIILTTNKPVMALGGFAGSDPILTTSDLALLVANGTVRFFLLNGVSRAGGGFVLTGGQLALATWVKRNCRAVPPHLWQSVSKHRNTTRLYDCAAT